MTVAELIKKLKEFEPSETVYLYEGDTNALEPLVRVEKKYNEDYEEDLIILT